MASLRKYSQDARICVFQARMVLFRILFKSSHNFGRQTCSDTSDLNSQGSKWVLIALRYAAQYSMRARLHRACSMQDTSDTQAQSRIAYVLINRYIYVLACVLRPHYTLGRPLSHSALDRFRSASCSHVNVRYETTRAAVYDTYIRRRFSVKSVSRDTIVTMNGQVRMNRRAGFKPNWLKIARRPRNNVIARRPKLLMQPKNFALCAQRLHGVRAFP